MDINITAIKEEFIEERTGCFKEIFEKFLNETEIEAPKQFPDSKQSRERIVAVLETLEKTEAILKKEKEKIKEALIALVGFDIEGNGKLPPYEPRKVEIDDSPTAYACTDESI